MFISRPSCRTLLCRALLIICSLPFYTTVANAVDESIKEKPTSCLGRPAYVQPSDEDSAKTGLSREILCIIVDTPLFRDLPGPEESLDLLRRYLRQEPYANLSDTDYKAVMEEAVRLWPQSRYAHAGLAHTLLASPLLNRAEKQRAANELRMAAEIAARQGKVRYVTEVALLLADLGDKTALDEYFRRMLQVASRNADKYIIYLQYALALATLSDDRADAFFRKAIQVNPKGVGEAYEFYSHYLLEHQKAQAVLDLLSPNSKAQQIVPESVFHSIRCRALEQLGRTSEVTTECPRGALV